MPTATYLQRRAFSGQGREAHNVTEVDGHTVVRLRYDRLPQDQLAGDRPAGTERATLAATTGWRGGPLRPPASELKTLKYIFLQILII
jgi:hypothetical protein